VTASIHNFVFNFTI
jgi:hypothetical protein